MRCVSGSFCTVSFWKVFFGYRIGILLWNLFLHLKFLFNINILI